MPHASAIDSRPTFTREVMLTPMATTSASSARTAGLTSDRPRRQEMFLNLAECRAGQRVDANEGAGNLERRQLAAALLLELGDVDRCVRHDIGHGNLAASHIRRADHGRFANACVL